MQDGRLLPFFLFLVSCVFWIHPSIALAQRPQETISVSPAVNRILTRARAGIEYAQQTSQDPLVMFLGYELPDWSRDLLQTILLPVDTSVQIVSRSTVQANQTTCFRTDLFLIEEMMSETRRALEAALAQANVGEILRLSDLFKFLQRQYEKLLRGGEDPNAKDDQWTIPREFDAHPEEISAEPPLCYFHSNYLPPNLSGYGCDTEALDTVLQKLQATTDPSYDTLKDLATYDRDAMAKVQATAVRYQSNAQAVSQLQDTINALVAGKNPDIPQAPPAREHRELLGCLDAAPEDLVFFTPRGNFSVEKNPQLIAERFRDLKMSQENDRPLPAWLQQDPAGGTVWSMALDSTKQSEIPPLTDFTGSQARGAASTFLASADPGLAIREALGGLSKSVGALSRLSQSLEGGLRGFARDFGYFLLRTCIDRPGRDRLQKMLKILLAQECFPYTSGAYLSDTCQKPRWAICDAASEGLPPGSVPEQPGCPDSSSAPGSP